MQLSPYIVWILIDFFVLPVQKVFSFPTHSFFPPSTPFYCFLVYLCCFSIPVTSKAAMPRGPEEGQQRMLYICNPAARFLQALHIFRLTVTASTSSPVPLRFVSSFSSKTCLEMLKNLCNYPVFLKSFFMCHTSHKCSSFLNEIA